MLQKWVCSSLTCHNHYVYKKATSFSACGLLFYDVCFYSIWRNLRLVSFFFIFPCVLLSFLCCLTGCASKVQHLGPQVVRAPNSARMLSDEDAARLHDLPFAKGVHPEKLDTKDGQTVIRYVNALSMQATTDFYVRDMEYLGWNLVSSFIADESCLIFEKPTRRCVITTRLEHDVCRVVLFLESKAA